MRLIIYLSILNYYFVSCVDPASYKGERSKVRMEAQRESDSLNNEVRKMEDTIYETVVEDGDTISFRKVAK